MAEDFFVPDTMPSTGNRGAQSNHKRDSSRIDLGTEPQIYEKPRRRNSATQSARAKVKWKNLKMKMRVAKKFEKDEVGAIRLTPLRNPYGSRPQAHPTPPPPAQVLGDDKQ